MGGLSTSYPQPVDNRYNRYNRYILTQVGRTRIAQDGRTQGRPHQTALESRQGHRTAADRTQGGYRTQGVGGRRKKVDKGKV